MKLTKYLVSKMAKKEGGRLVLYAAIRPGYENTRIDLEHGSYGGPFFLTPEEVPHRENTVVVKCLVTTRELLIKGDQIFVTGFETDGVIKNDTKG